MRLVVVTGVGTGVGKTYVAAALARAWGRVSPVLAYKPIETGVLGDIGEDQAALHDASTFHVKPSPLQLCFRTGVTPSLAARREGGSIVLDDLAAEVARLRQLIDLIVELPGGLFSPLSDDGLNADLVRLFHADHTLLVAPDRLGVLHDVLSSLTACDHLALSVSCVVMTPPATPDSSTGTNANELRRRGVKVVDGIPRAPLGEVAEAPALADLLRICSAELTPAIVKGRAE